MRKVLMGAVLLFASMLCTGQAHAWNCSDPLAERVPVAAGTQGTTGDGDGQLFLGTGGEGVAGQLYECKVVPPGTTPPPGSIITNTNSSSANASSSSTSKSSSKSTANGGNASATGGSVGPINTTSLATGGSIKNSGNSSNTNTNTANGGAGGAGGNSNQSQTQSTSSSATNNGTGNGNGANNSSYSSTTNVAATKIPVASAIAPPVLPTNPCFKGIGVGVQTMAFGGSFGGGKIDSNCAILEAARLAPNLLSRCKVYISNKYVKAAGVTLDDCLNEPDAPVVAPVAVVNAPQPIQAPTPPVFITVEPAQPVVVPAPNVVIVAPAPAPSVVVHAAPRKHVPCVPTQPNTTCKPDKKIVFTDDGRGNIQAERATL